MADQPLWVKKEAGELLSSADWNGMQRLAQADIAKVGARVDAVEAAAGRRQGTQLVVAHMVGNEGSFENGGGSWTGATDTYGPGVQLNGCSSQFLWEFIPSPRLQFELGSPSIVSLQARGTTYSNGGYIWWTQFFLSQGVSRAPVRINPGLVTNWSGLRHTLTYTPNATTWPKWLADNQAVYVANKRWPVCGQVMNASAAYLHFQQSEQVELPAGAYICQFGVATNTTSNNGYYLQFYNLTLSATIIPL